MKETQYSHMLKRCSDRQDRSLISASAPEREPGSRTCGDNPGEGLAYPD